MQGAFSVTNLSHLHNFYNDQQILHHLTTEDYITHDYSGCVRPQFTIPTLIIWVLDQTKIVNYSYDRCLSISQQI